MSQKLTVYVCHSDEGRISVVIKPMRFFTTFMNYVRRLSVCVQNDTSNTST
ncbi:hypothetical protein [Chryseobacterium sp. CH21]|uniref:hypothetical protein n=1 Tax=Chryseobacterium sp. CH21 TaxID=713556 RepID=UPI0013E9916C|nr:hypothetical protein [Chryseobacterium sp. CH21]